MNSEQQIILWVGLILTLVYLFTNKSFHNALFTTSSKPGTVTDADFTTQPVTQPAGTDLV